MRTLLLTAILSFCFLFSKALNGGKSKIKNYNIARFSGKIKSNRDGDSLRVMYEPRIVSAYGTAIADTSITHSTYFYIPVQKNGTFRFKLENVGSIGRMYLTFKRGQEYIQIGGRYMVERGDNITLSINIHDSLASARFFGSNSAKYTCVDSILANYDDELISISNSIGMKYKERSFNYFFELNKNLKSLKEKKKSDLKYFKNQISENVYTMCDFEIESIADFKYCIILGYNYFNNSQDSLKEKIKRYYLDSCQFKIDINSANFKKILPVNFYAIYYLIINTAINIGLETDDLPSITNVYDRMKKMYSGAVLDKILTVLTFDTFVHLHLFCIKFTSDQIDSCLLQADKIVKTDYLLALLREQLVLVKGYDAYDFHLKDTTGNIIRMSDFRGKTVMIDAWYTGCTGCAMFYKFFTDSVESEFRADSNFKVISICADVSESQWKKSIYSGKYTNPRQINLFANGFYSDYFNHYHPTGMPFIIFVDKHGKI